MHGSNNILVRRCMAFVIDWALIFLICLGLFMSGPRWDVAYLLRPSLQMFSAYGGILGALGFVVLPLFKDCLFKGASLGKRICGITVYDDHSQDPAKTGALILRNVTFYIPFVELIVCVCNKGRTLGDMLSSSYVDLRNRM